jgi:hypothetical protein
VVAIDASSVLFWVAPVPTLALFLYSPARRRNHAGCLCTLLVYSILSRQDHFGVNVVMENFRFRLNCIDNYQATQTDLDPALRRGNGPSQKSREASPLVPIVRAFGATETGQKVCAHIHGALPYLYIEYAGSLDNDTGELDM